MPSIDASSPVRVNNNSGTATTASFTPPASSLLVVCICSDDSSGTPSFSCSSTPSLTFTNQVETSSAADGASAIYTAPVSTSQGYTVTAGNGGVGRISQKVYVVTGHDTSSPVGNVFNSGGSNVTTNNWSPTVTTTADGSRVIGCATDWNALGLPSSTDTEDAFHIANWISGLSAYKASDTTSSGTSVPVNFDASGTSNAAWTGVIVEIKAAATGPVAKNFSETETFTDANIVIGTAYTDSGSESESNILIGQNLNDTHFLTELIVSDAFLSQSDMVSLTDSLSTTAAVAYSDSQTLVDNLQLNIPYIDTVSLSELLENLAASSLSDSGTLSESLLITNYLADSVVFDDQLSVSTGGTQVSFSDTLTLAESIIVTLQLVDSHSLIESSPTIGRFLTDSVTGVENLIIGFSLQDSASMQDIITTLGQPSLVDQFGVSENFTIPGVYPPTGGEPVIIDILEVSVPFLYTPVGMRLVNKAMRRWI